MNHEHNDREAWLSSIIFLVLILATAALVVAHLCMGAWQ